MAVATDGKHIHRTEDLVVITCCRCGIAFAVPSHWSKKRRETNTVFYCPNGHHLSYHTNVADRLRKKLQQAEAQIAWHRERREAAQEDRDKARRQAAAQKGVATRRGKQLARVKNGVCPCCNRSFKNLAEHMKSKHPDHAG